MWKYFGPKFCSSKVWLVLQMPCVLNVAHFFLQLWSFYNLGLFFVGSLNQSGETDGNTVRPIHPQHKTTWMLIRLFCQDAQYPWPYRNYSFSIAQIALDFPSVKKSAPNHPGKPLHPHANVEKSAPNHPGRPLHPPPFRAMPIYGSNTFQKEASVTSQFFLISAQCDILT